MQTFHLENDEKVSQKWPKHKCFDEESVKEKVRNLTSAFEVVRKWFRLWGTNTGEAPEG